MTYIYQNNSNATLNKLKEILSKEEFYIVVNHLIYGYSFAEIAKVKNMSINTIMSKYRRSIKKAYNKIKGEL